MQVHLVPERMQQWVTFWRITGAESLCVVAVAFRVSRCLELAGGTVTATACGRSQPADATWSGSQLKGFAFPAIHALQTRLSLHLPLQLAALAIVVWNVPQMCAEVRADRALL